MLGSGRANDGNFASWWHPSPGWEAREADRDDGAFRLSAQKHAGLPGAAGGDHHPVAVEEVAENIVALSEKTQAVGEIIATVNDVAERSNLLALNAAIEAAAAGEQGNRFSVVANEMKNLADQAKDSTVQVRTILSDIQKGINSSVMLTEEAVKRVESGKQQGSGPGPEIKDALRPGRSFEMLDGRSDQHFRIGPRDEHSRTDVQLDVPEGAPASDVGDRLTGLAS